MEQCLDGEWLFPYESKCTVGYLECTGNTKWEYAVTTELNCRSNLTSMLCGGPSSEHIMARVVCSFSKREEWCTASVHLGTDSSVQLNLLTAGDLTYLTVCTS